MIGNAFRQVKIEALSSLDMAAQPPAALSFWQKTSFWDPSEKNSVPNFLGNNWKIIALVLAVIITGSVIGTSESDNAKIYGTVMAWVLGSLLLAYFIINFAGGDTSQIMTLLKNGAPELKAPTFSRSWNNWHSIGILSVMMVILFGCYLYFTYNTTQFPGSDKDMVNSLINTKVLYIENLMNGYVPKNESMTQGIISRTCPYDKIPIGTGAAGSVAANDRRSLVNFRPLTVRLAGYLGGKDTSGKYTINDGVFDMTKGIIYSLKMGARGFVFNIGFEDKSPCNPVVIFRDKNSIKTSKNTGSIREGMNTIAQNAFTNLGGDKVNYDPIIVILYLRELPKGPTQQKQFFEKIAISLDPISAYHLNTVDGVVYNRCKSEDTLFLSANITDFQKKIIVLVNYQTENLESGGNPKNSLHWWTNARIYQNPEYYDANNLGNVTPRADQGTSTTYVEVGYKGKIQNIGGIPQTLNPASSTYIAPELNSPAGNYATKAATKFQIIMTSPEDDEVSGDESRFLNEYNLTLHKLLNCCSAQCIPLDVLYFATREFNSKYYISEYRDTKSNINACYLSDLTKKPTFRSTTVQQNPLQFWAILGWTRIWSPDEFAASTTLQARCPTSSSCPPLPPPSTPSSTGSTSQPFTDYGDYKEGFTEVKHLTTLGYSKPKPQKPSKPSPTMNAAGGVLSIG